LAPRCRVLPWHKSLHFMKLS